MRVLRNAPSTWLDKADQPPIIDPGTGAVLGWPPFVAMCWATIEIKEGSVEWATAYEQWRLGKNPTEDVKWKVGVFMCYTKEE